MDMLDNWQRIEQIIKWAGSASVSAFAREIGLNRGENLYQIKRGNNGISKELADIVSARYPQISKAWLLTGEGQMLAEENVGRTNIPFYESDAVELAALSDRPKASSYLSLPLFQGADFAALTFTGAMSPDIPVGSVIFVQKISPEQITPGGTYLIISSSFSGIRIIRKDPQSEYLRLVPGNKNDYDEIVINSDSIVRLFVIKGLIINKSV